jgi:hypothetical protein
MNCSTCRGSFSGSFDGRLSGDVRQDFIRHVQACGVCGPEYALYQRVFSAVRGLPDGAAPQFRAPAEVPGALYAAQPFGARPRFARVAAAILILIGLASTHVLVFQWSRDHAPGTEPRAGGPAIAAAASRRAPRSRRRDRSVHPHRGEPPR